MMTYHTTKFGSSFIAAFSMYSVDAISLRMDSKESSNASSMNPQTAVSIYELRQSILEREKFEGLRRPLLVNVANLDDSDLLDTANGQVRIHTLQQKMTF